MKIEIELCHECNIKCPSCCRLCGYEEMLGIKRNNGNYLSEWHIDYLEKEIRRNGRVIGEIKLLGGEPTLSPILAYATEKLIKLKDEGLLDKLVIWSNGISQIQNVPSGVEITISPPQKKKHRCWFISPLDYGYSGHLCEIPRRCGISYNVYGFNLGGECSSICEFFQVHKYYQSKLPQSWKEFLELGPVEKDLCSRCCRGWGKLKTLGVLEFGDIMGRTFLEQIERNKMSYIPPPLLRKD